MMWLFYWSGLLLLFSTRETVSLECYTCENMDDPDSCHNITQAGNEQSCFADVHTYALSKTFTLGITDNENCGAIPNYTNTIAKRYLEEKCFECCSKDKCNNRLCQHLKPSTCIDDVKVDCAHINEKFNICTNVNKAKEICPKFCRLCSLVDGNWAEWSGWSSCDVTCDSGIQTRKRTCTNPAPAYHGMQCIGNDTDTKSCDNVFCPVNGGWSEWSDWGSCSVTCDSGLKKRNRSCSNPYPSRYGNHCFGDSTEVEMCMQGPCQKSTVAFKTHVVVDKSLSNNKVIIFTQNILNTRGAYNNKTGIFVAPVGGIYLFTVQLCLKGGSYSYFGITVKGEIVSSALLGEKDWTKCYTMDAMIKADMGDEVSVKCTLSCDSSEYLWSNSVYGRSSFSGVLI